MAQLEKNLEDIIYPENLNGIGIWSDTNKLNWNKSLIMTLK